MHRNPLTPLAIALGLAWPGLSLAQSVAGTQTIVVTGEAVRADLAANGPKNPFRTASSSNSHIQVIGREEIEQLRPSDVFELVNMAGGVVATPTSSRMGFSTLSIRGDSNFRWMVDGIYLDAGTASRVMRSIPVSVIEEIKIVRGSSALTLGPMTNTESPSGGAAVDGFIVVRTRKPKKSEVQMRLAVETNQGLEESLWLGKTFKSAGNAYIAALASHSENESPKSPLDNGKDYNVDRSSLKGMLKGGLEYAGWDIDLMAYQDASEYQIPNTNSHVKSPGNNDWYVKPSRTTLGAISGSHTWNAQHTTLFSLSMVRLDQTVVSRGGATDTAALKVNAENIVAAEHYNLRHNVFLDQTKLMLGADYRHWVVPNGQNPAYYPGIRREEITTGWFVQGEHNMLDDRLHLDASVRQDSVDQVHALNFVFGGVGNNGSVASTQIHNVKLPSATFYALGGKYDFDKVWSASARLGQASQPFPAGMKSAPGVELAGDTQHKWEMGLEASLSRGINVGVNYFKREAKNEKQVFGYTSSSGACTSTSPTAPTPTLFVPCFSQGTTTRAGVELAVSGEFDVRSRYRFSVTHFTQLAGGTVAVPLTQQTPHDIAELTLSHGLGRYTFTGATKYVSKYIGAANGSLGSVPYSGYTKLDLGLGYDWKFDSIPVRTTFYGRNVTDQRFETAVGIQDVGRVIGVEMMASF